MWRLEKILSILWDVFGLMGWWVNGKLRHMGQLGRGCQWCFRDPFINSFVSCWLPGVLDRITIGLKSSVYSNQNVKMIWLKHNSSFTDIPLLASELLGLTISSGMLYQCVVLASPQNGKLAVLACLLSSYASIESMLISYQRSFQ